MTKPDLKWRFTAYYIDDSVLVQPANDLSIDKTRSSFADVQQDKLSTFTLSCNSSYYSLNLKTGEFATNASRFKLHSGEIKDIKLIYFRRVTAHLSANDTISYHVEYNLGYSAVDDQGQNIQRTIILQ